MAKPIFVVKLKRGIVDGQQGLSDLARLMNEKLNREYNVLVVDGNFSEPVSFECFNDCKGLRDEDFNQIVTDLIKNGGTIG